jgi:hypothetical protein
MYDDMREAYNEARVNDNPASMERLTRVIRDLARQIKDHEIHERETIPRKDAVRCFQLLGILVGKKLKDVDGQVLNASEMIVDIELEGRSLLELEMG